MFILKAPSTIISGIILGIYSSKGGIKSVVATDIFQFIIFIIGIPLIAILGYNYFAGSPSEKENAREIVNKVKSIGGSVKDLIKSEHLKYKEGKYDEVLNKTGSLLKKIKEKLPERLFLQIHRSYIINFTKIIDIEDNSVLVRQDVVPVSRSNKSELMKKLNLL